MSVRSGSRRESCSVYGAKIVIFRRECKGLRSRYKGIVGCPQKWGEVSSMRKEKLVRCCNDERPETMAWICSVGSKENRDQLESPLDDIEAKTY